MEREGIAYVPERVAIPPQWTVRGALVAYAMLGDLGDDAPERVEAALRRLGLEELADRRVGRLSKGNVQRLAIAQALLGDRELMVLDEPTDGLDPVWIAELRDASWPSGARPTPRACSSWPRTTSPRSSGSPTACWYSTRGGCSSELEPGGDGGGGLEAAFLRRVALEREGAA